MSRAREIADRDLAATELILDADNDTSITADTDDRIDFRTAGNDVMHIDSSGKLGLGTSTPATSLEISGTTDNSQGGTFPRIQISTTSDSNPTYSGSLDIVEKQSSATSSAVFGTAHVYGFRTMLDGNTNVLKWFSGSQTTVTERMGLDRDTGNLTLNSGNLVMGTSGKGIDFSSNTQSAVSGVGNQSELLDFYEEGSWTPVAYGVSTSGSVTSGTLVGQYTRIGRIVHAEARATAVVLSSANGSYYVDGLPFTVGGTAYNSGSVSLYKVDFDPDTFVEINASGTTLYFLVSRDNTTWTTLDQSAFGSQHYWHFTIIYTV